MSFADYTIAFANTKNEKSAYMISVGKAYDPEPAEDEEDLRPQWDVTYKAVDDGYQTFLTADDVADYSTNLSLSAENFYLFGLRVGGGYVTKDANASATS